MNVIFAAAENEATLPRIDTAGSAIFEWGTLLGAILAVAVIVLLWIIFSGRSRRHAARRAERRKRRESLRRNATQAATFAEERHEKSAGRRRKRRHHRPRNPTLAETGGLPPIRGHDQEPQIPPH
jgi:hypothetical protein